MGKSTPSAPDYRGAAQQTAAADREALAQQTWGNRINQYNPLGSIEYTPEQVYDPATEQYVTRWSQNQTLTDSAQGALDDQMYIQQGKSAAAKGLLGNAGGALSQQTNWNNFSGYGAVPTPYGSYPQQQQNYGSYQQRPNYGQYDQPAPGMPQPPQDQQLQGSGKDGYGGNPPQQPKNYMGMPKYSGQQTQQGQQQPQNGMFGGGQQMPYQNWSQPNYGQGYQRQPQFNPSYNPYAQYQEQIDQNTPATDVGTGADYQNSQDYKDYQSYLEGKDSPPSAEPAPVIPAPAPNQSEKDKQIAAFFKSNQASGGLSQEQAAAGEVGANPFGFMQNPLTPAQQGEQAIAARKAAEAKKPVGLTAAEKQAKIDAYFAASQNN